MKSRLPLAAYLAVCILWGSTYLAIALAVRTLPPFLMIGLRFTIAGTILLIWCLARGERLPPWKTFLHSAITGFLLLCVGNGGLSWSEVRIASGLAAIILAALPLWMVILDKPHWHENFSNARVISGLLLGFAGVVYLVTAGGSSVHFSLHNTSQVSALVVLFVGSLSWAWGSLYSKRHSVPGSTFIKGSLQMLSAGVVLLLFSLCIGNWSHISWASVSRQSWGGLIYLIIFGSLVGYVSFIYVLDVWPAARVGTYAYVNPVVAVFLGWAIAGEPLSIGQFIGLSVILAGVMLVNSKALSKGRIPNLAARKT